jgi:hypothetical protein
MMNRHERRRFAADRRHFASSDDLAVATNRTELIRLVATLAEADPTVTGATVITPEGEVDYIDGAILRQGGTA